MGRAIGGRITQMPYVSPFIVVKADEGRFRGDIGFTYRQAVQTCHRVKEGA
jgi:hypothetical protein